MHHYPLHSTIAIDVPLHGRKQDGRGMVDGWVHRAMMGVRITAGVGQFGVFFHRPNDSVYITPVMAAFSEEATLNHPRHVQASAILGSN